MVISVDYFLFEKLNCLNRMLVYILIFILNLLYGKGDWILNIKYFWIFSKSLCLN